MTHDILHHDATSTRRYVDLLFWIQLIHVQRARDGMNAPRYIACNRFRSLLSNLRIFAKFRGEHWVSISVQPARLIQCLHAHKQEHRCG